jgi:prepilin peptidase CpaA
MLAWAQITIVVCALAAVWYDFRHRRIPNALVLITTALAVWLLVSEQALWPGLTWKGAGIAAIAGFALFAWFYARGLMGAGDVKYFAVAGLLVGPWGLCLVWLVASLLGGVHAVTIRLRGGQEHPAAKRGIPYAGYMAIGILLMLPLRTGIEAARFATHYS